MTTNLEPAVGPELDKALAEALGVHFYYQDTSHGMQAFTYLELDRENRVYNPSTDFVEAMKMIAWLRREYEWYITLFFYSNGLTRVWVGGGPEGTIAKTEGEAICRATLAAALAKKEIKNETLATS